MPADSSTLDDMPRYRCHVLHPDSAAVLTAAGITDRRCRVWCKAEQNHSGDHAAVIQGAIVHWPRQPIEQVA